MFTNINLYIRITVIIIITAMLAKIVYLNSQNKDLDAKVLQLSIQYNQAKKQGEYLAGVIAINNNITLKRESEISTLRTQHEIDQKRIYTEKDELDRTNRISKHWMRLAFSQPTNEHVPNVSVATTNSIKESDPSGYHIPHRVNAEVNNFVFVCRNNTQQLNTLIDSIYLIESHHNAAIFN